MEDGKLGGDRPLRFLMFGAGSFTLVLLTILWGDDGELSHRSLRIAGSALTAGISTALLFLFLYWPRKASARPTPSALVPFFDVSICVAVIIAVALFVFTTPLGKRAAERLRAETGETRATVQAAVRKIVVPPPPPPPPPPSPSPSPSPSPPQPQPQPRPLPPPPPPVSVAGGLWVKVGDRRGEGLAHGKLGFRTIPSIEEKVDARSTIPLDENAISGEVIVRCGAGETPSNNTCTHRLGNISPGTYRLEQMIENRFGELWVRLSPSS